MRETCREQISRGLRDLGRVRASHSSQVNNLLNLMGLTEVINFVVLRAATQGPVEDSCGGSKIVDLVLDSKNT